MKRTTIQPRLNFLNNSSRTPSPNTVVDNTDDNTTVKNCVFSKPRARRRSSVAQYGVSPQQSEIHRPEVHSQFRRTKLIEAGTGFLIAVMGKLLKRRKRTVVQAIRDFIYKRVKLLAALSYTIDLFRVKKAELFNVFADSLRQISVSASKDSAVFSFQTESQKTPKFRFSNPGPKLSFFGVSAEEPLFTLAHILEQRLMRSAFACIKKTIRRSLDRFLDSKALHGNTLSGRKARSFLPRKSAYMIMDLIHILFRNRLLKHFHILKHKTKSSANRQGRNSSHRVTFSSRSSFAAKTNILIMIVNGLALKNLKGTFTRLKQTNPRGRPLKREVSARVKDLSRSFTPIRGSMAIDNNKTGGLKKNRRYDTDSNFLPEAQEIKNLAASSRHTFQRVKRGDLHVHRSFINNAPEPMNPQLETRTKIGSSTLLNDRSRCGLNNIAKNTSLCLFQSFTKTTNEINSGNDTVGGCGVIRESIEFKRKKDLRNSSVSVSNKRLEGKGWAFQK